MAAGGVVGATFVKSPAQLAAEVAPPSTTVLSAPVTKQVVRSTVVTRGTVVAERTVNLPAGPPGGEAGRMIVTRTPHLTGEQVELGKVLIELSGRPVIALEGSTPAYRDLEVGARGPDVLALQNSLKKIGHYRGGDTPGEFGAATTTGISRLYRELGYDAPASNSGQQDSSGQSATDAVTQARRNLEDVLSERASTDRRANELNQTADQLETELLQAQQDNLAAVEEALVSASLSGAAQARLEAATDDEERQAAEEALQQAEARRLAATEALQNSNRQIAGAEAALLAARSQGEAVQNAGDAGDLDTRIRRAREDLATAERRRNEAAGGAGIVVPFGEIVFLPAFPAHLLSVSAQVGDMVEDSALSIASGRLELRGQLRLRDRELVNLGAEVEILDELGKGIATGAVSHIGQPGEAQASTGDEAGQEPRLPITITPATPLGPEFAGRDLRLSIVSKQTPDEVLAVPVTAVTTKADGRTFVARLGGDDRQPIEIPVRVGESGSGIVEVEPLEGGILRQGDRVVTGERST